MKISIPGLSKVLSATAQDSGCGQSGHRENGSQSMCYRQRRDIHKLLPELFSTGGKVGTDAENPAIYATVPKYKERKA